MLLAQADDAEIAKRLAGPGIALDLGTARARLRSDVPALPPVLRALYGSFPLADPVGVFDSTINLRRARGLREFIRPQVVLISDGAMVFEPFPADTFLPLLEWGLNYLLATRLNAHLLLHAGVVETGGKAILLPAMPGFGKSTLTAALVARGFRLLSDEFGVVRLADAMIQPLLRPIGLKNESIDVIARFAPDATIGPRYEKTRKGTVAHMAPDAIAVEGRGRTAVPRLVIFPRFAHGADVSVEPVSASQAFARLAFNAFNYELLGPTAFDAVCSIVRQSAACRVVYGDLDSAVETVKQLVAEAR